MGHPSNRCLLVAAAPKEACAVLEGFGIEPKDIPVSGDPVRMDDCFDLIRAGVGKSSANRIISITLLIAASVFPPKSDLFRI